MISVSLDWSSLLEPITLPLNERFFLINLRESSKCNICDDDMVEDLHHFLFECKTLRCIRQELFTELETVIKSFYLDSTFSELPPFQKLQFLIGDFCFSFSTELGLLLDKFSKKNYYVKYFISLIVYVIFIFYLKSSANKIMWYIVYNIISTKESLKIPKGYIRIHKSKNS
jgi:hypothetical protein